MANRINWATIRTDYVAHPELTLEDLAKKYNVSIDAISSHSSVGKWPEIRRTTQKRIQEKAIQKLIDNSANELARINAINLEFANRLQEKLIALAENVTSIDDVRKASVAFENIYNIQRKILNADGPRVDFDIAKYLDTIERSCTMIAQFAWGDDAPIEEDADA